ncbi:MAG: hypothetical protein HY329_11440 [Chloroflexi bacterium]|nr:hypothetical protein [Chloroflexota bacterium]
MTERSSPPLDASRPWSALGRRQRIFVGAALLVLATLMLLLSVRSTVRLYHYMTGTVPPREVTVEAIAGWMTVPFVSRRFHVPEAELFAALGTDASTHRRSSLRQIAQAAGRDEAEILAIVRATVVARQPTSPGAPRPPDAPPWSGNDAPRPPPGLPPTEGATWPPERAR